MKKTQYIDVFKEAFLITWKNKFLWFFGFIILISTIATNLNSDNFETISQYIFKKSFLSFLQSNNSTLIIFEVTLFLLWLVFFLVRIASVAAIIKSASNINLYNQISRITIINTIKGYISRLFLLEMVVSFSLLIIMIVISLPVIYLFSVNAGALAFSCLIIAIVITLPILVLGYYLYKYATFCIILLDERVMISLELAYAAFLRNIKASLLMSMLLFALSIVFLFGVFVVLLVAGMFLSIFYLFFIKMIANIFAILLLLAALFFICIFISGYIAFLNVSMLIFFREIAFLKKEIKKEETSLVEDGNMINQEIA